MRDSSYSRKLISLLYVLKCVVSFFSCANLYDVFNVIYKYLAVADVTGVQNLFGSLYNRSYRNLGDNYINLNLGQKVGFNRNTSVVFGATSLLTAA